MGQVLVLDNPPAAGFSISSTSIMVVSAENGSLLAGISYLMEGHELKLAAKSESDASYLSCKR